MRDHFSIREISRRTGLSRNTVRKYLRSDIVEPKFNVADRRLRPIRPTQEGMTMERTEVLEMMGELKLYGMKSAYDETLATALKRKHEPQQLVGDLLKAEISEKHARSIRYQLAIAKLPLAKDLDDFAFKSTPINENLVRDLAGGGFIAQQRNVVLVGGTEPAS